MGRTATLRNLKIADQMQRYLSQLIHLEFSSKDIGLLTIQSVELSADYAHSKVFYTVFGAKPSVVQPILEARSGYLRSRLFKLMHIHTIPRLHFRRDTSVEEGIAMSALIKTVVN